MGVRASVEHFSGEKVSRWKTARQRRQSFPGHTKPAKEMVRQQTPGGQLFPRSQAGHHLLEQATSTLSKSPHATLRASAAVDYRRRQAAEPQGMRAMNHHTRGVIAVHVQEVSKPLQYTWPSRLESRHVRRVAMRGPKPEHCCVIPYPSPLVGVVYCAGPCQSARCSKFFASARLCSSREYTASQALVTAVRPQPHRL